MKKPSDISGQRFGMLTAIAIDHVRKYRGCGKYFWRCECDCGQLTVVDIAKLKKGSTRSCECLRQQRPEGILNSVASMYRANARNRSLLFELSNERCRELFTSPCHYCGVVGSNCRSYYNREIDNLSVRYNGIDRVDNSRGYVEGNVVPCCSDCNMAKREMSAEQFISLCKRVVDHRGV